MTTRTNRLRRVAPERALSIGELEGIAGLTWLEDRGIAMPIAGRGTGPELSSEELEQARAEILARKPRLTLRSRSHAQAGRR